jgi:hypothetical protein
MSSPTAFEWGTPQIETVEFLGEQLSVIPGPDADTTKVLLRPMCENLDVSPGDQYDRIRRDETYAERWWEIPTPSAGGQQVTFCLALSMVPGWLCSLNTPSKPDEKRQKHIRYKRECYRVIYEHFLGASATSEARAMVNELLPASVVEAAIADVKQMSSRDHATLLEKVVALLERSERQFAWLIRWRNDEWKPFPEPLRATVVEVQRKHFGRDCMFCRLRPVLDESGRFVGDFDHWDGDATNLRRSNCVPMCLYCNRHDKREDLAAFHRKYQRRYEAFQHHLEMAIPDLTRRFAERRAP